MKIYFSHGKESGPNGTKINKLVSIARKHNFDISCVDYTRIKLPDDRVQHLIQILQNDNEKEFILVGSSMGAYVSLVVAESLKIKGLFLLAPALYIQDYKIQKFTNKYQNNISIVHGWNDNVIPVKNSISFSEKTKCNLHLIDGDHRLIDSLEIIEQLFENFIKRLI